MDSDENSKIMKIVNELIPCEINNGSSGHDLANKITRNKNHNIL